MTLVDRLHETADMLARSVGTEADVTNVREAIARIEAGDALANACGWSEAQDPGYARWRALVREQDGGKG